MRQLPYTAGASVHVGADRFDAAITEEISDDLPAGDCISTARFCRAHLLRGSGTFYPRRAAMCAHLPYMATSCLIWQPPALYGNQLPCMATTCLIRQPPALYGNHLPYMATSFLIWQPPRAITSARSPPPRRLFLLLHNNISPPPQQQVGAAGGRARVPRGGIRRARL